MSEPRKCACCGQRVERLRLTEMCDADAIMRRAADSSIFGVRVGDLDRDELLIAFGVIHDMYRRMGGI